jgi:predicted RNase H-like HicB family nuclease
MDMFVFTGIILQDGEIYTSLCPELDIATQAVSPTEAKGMLLEATTLYLGGAIEDGLPILRPIPPNEDPRLESPNSIKEVFRFKVDVAFRAYA